MVNRNGAFIGAEIYRPSLSWHSKTLLPRSHSQALAADFVVQKKPQDPHQDNMDGNKPINAIPLPEIWSC